MPSYTVTTSFEMTDGRILSCEYDVSYTPAQVSGPPEHCYPEESDVSDPTYKIDGEEVDYAKLPKGLAKIADAMYEDDSDDRFSRKESEPEDDRDWSEYDDPRDWG